MGGYLSQPKTEKEVEVGVWPRRYAGAGKKQRGRGAATRAVQLPWAVAAMQGWRTSMEDSHLALPEFDNQTALFGVFDGHGGREVALYVAANLGDTIKTMPEYSATPRALGPALRDSFMAIDLVVKDLREELIADLSDEEEGDYEKEMEALNEEGDMDLQELLGRFGVQVDGELAELLEVRAAERARQEAAGAAADAEVPESGMQEEQGVGEGDADDASEAAEDEAEDEADDEVMRTRSGQKSQVPQLELDEESPGWSSGCTAVVAAVEPGRIVVANAGDSRCVICINGVAKNLSEDHKPEDAPERARIEKAGSVVDADSRIDGGLNLSRALGDHTYKRNLGLSAEEQAVTALPDLVAEPFGPDTGAEFLLLACDGIWNSMESDEAIAFVRAGLVEGKAPVEVCKELCDACMSPTTEGDGTGCDNETAMIVLLAPVKSFRKLSGDANGSATTKKSTTTKRRWAQVAQEEEEEEEEEGEEAKPLSSKPPGAAEYKRARVSPRASPPSRPSPRAPIRPEYMATTPM